MLTSLRAGAPRIAAVLATTAFAAASWGADTAAPVVGSALLVDPKAIVAGDTAWMLTSATIVLMMTLPGLAFFYGGLVRKKNILSTMAQVFVAAVVVTLMWFLFGYSLAFSAGTAWLGGAGKMIGGHLTGGAGAVAVHGLMPNVPEAVFAIFQCGFAVITAALVVGAFAERVKFGVAAIFCGIWSVLVYAPVAHWVWMPQGWLYELGVRDFAGGLVVHVNAGAAALAVALVVGPRRGFGRDPMIPSNLAYMLIGAGLLWIGWFGFNGGSAGAASAGAGLAVVNTQVAAATAALLYALLEWVTRGQTSMVGLATGAVAGLVAITPAAGYVSVDSAYLFGMAGGLASYVGLVWVKPLLNIDDSLDVFAIHGMVGIVGSLMTPFLAVRSIAGFEGKPAAEALAVVAVFFYSFAVSALVMKLLDLIIGARVKAEDEIDGLDLSQHGEQIE